MKGELKEVASVFFKLGCIAFGGPAAHIAMMQEEIVEKRKWMSSSRFLDLMGATNLIPGPNSTEMTMHCGYERAGVKGLFVAGACFIFPAVVITLVFAYILVNFGTLEPVQRLVYGIKPAVLAIILAAVMKLGKKAIKGPELLALGIVTAIVAIFGVHEVVALLLCALLGTAYFMTKKNVLSSFDLFGFGALMVSLKSLAPSLKIALTFLKVGAILYGSGYVLFAYLDAELVDKGLLSRPDLLEAIAIGQLTPGPVLSTSTYIGYQMYGVSGAIAATLGIFLPSFFFVWLLNPLIDRMRQSQVLSFFLDCVNVAAVAIMAVVLIMMAKDSIIDTKTALILLWTIIAMYGFKWGSLYLILGASALGYFLFPL